MRCSYCNKAIASPVTLVDGDETRYYCSLTCLDKWLYRMGYRYAKDIRDRGNGESGTSTGVQPAQDDRRSSGELQSGPPQAEHAEGAD